MRRLPRQLPALAALAALAATVACASTGARPEPFPRPGAHQPTSPPPPGPGNPPGSANPAPVAPPPAPSGKVSVGTGPDAGYAVTGTALSLRGAPYRNGGADPAGFDCSGFVRYVFDQNGVRVPRTVSEQFRAGRRVNETELEPGDLVFFSTVAPGASHVGIAIGGDEFVHAPSSSGEVRVEHLSAAYWATRFVGARRVL